MQSKFSVPDASELVLRPRVSNAMDTVAPGFLWVSGPTGAGKTSTLALWAAPQRERTLWYRVEESDADLATLFAALREAVASLPTEVPIALPPLNPEQMPQLMGFAKRFLAELFVKLPPQCVLVFEDCHEVPEQSPFVPFIDLLLQARRADCTVIASSRAPLPAMLLKYLAQPHHAILPWDDLKCTHDEARALSRQWHREPPTDAQLAQADGWPAGLALILRLQFTDRRIAPDPSRNAAQAFSAIAGGAFAALLPQHQIFLRGLAFAQHHTPSLAATLTGVSSSDASDYLLALWRAHFFVERCDAANSEGEPLFRLHPLLQAFLQELAQVSHSADALQAMWRQLGLWHSARAEHAEAIDYFMRADDWSNAATLFEQQAPMLLASGQFAMLIGWVQRFPDAELAKHPGIHYWHGMSLSQINPAAARNLLAKAHHAFLQQGALEPAILAVCGICDSYFLEWGDWREAATWVEVLWVLCNRAEHRYSSPAMEARILATGASAIFPCPSHPLIHRWIGRARELIVELPDVRARIGLSRFVVGYLWWTGAPKVTRRLVSELAPLARSQSASPAMAMELLVWCGITVGCDADLPRSIAFLDEAQAIGDTNGVALFDFHIQLHRALGALGGQDLPRAERAFGQLPTLIVGQGVGARHLFALVEPGVHLLRGHPREALDAARAAMEEFKDSGWIFGRRFLQLMLAEMLVVNKEYVQARTILEQTLAFAHDMPSPFFAMMSHYMLAACEFSDLPLSDSGLEHLRSAIHVGKQEGFRHCHPWWIPELMAPLFATALEANIGTDYICDMIQRNKLPPPQVADSGAKDHWPYPLRVYVLGRFSLVRHGEVMRFVGKAQQRVLEFIKALAAHGGRAVASETLCDLLWPDSNGDAAKAALDVTLHRARKLLGVDNALLLQDGKLSFNSHLVWLDLSSLGQICSHIDAQRDTPQTLGEQSAILTARLLKRYCGTVLSAEGDGWLLPIRQTWTNRFERAASALLAVAMKLDQLDRAKHLFACMLEVGAMSEATAQNYLAYLQARGDSHAARDARQLLAAYLQRNVNQRNP